MLETLTANFHRLGTAALLTLALLICQQLSVANHSSAAEGETTPVAINRLN